MSVYLREASIPKPNAVGEGDWILKGLTDVTVLFGKNGSGKSILLRTLRDNNVANSHYVAPERSGNISFNPTYMQQQLDAQGRKNATPRNYVPEYREQVVSRIQTYFLRRGEIRDGSPPGHPSEIEKLLSQLLPDFGVTVGARNPPYELRRLSNQEIISSVDYLSSGEAQLFTVSLDILTMAAIWELEEKHERLLLIDEPDAHIHPDLQIRFADFLVSVVNRFEVQVIVATHSTTLLAALGQFGSDSTSVIYLTGGGHPLQAKVFDEVQRELATCLGGHALMGPLFAAPLLLVEGDDDYRIWSQVPRHHVISLSVLPANGDEIYRYQRALERLFGSLRNTEAGILGFALLDGDKSLPQESAETPQQFIKYIQMRCHEAENLYLSDEVLADLGLNWQAASVKISQQANSYGNKAEFLGTVASWDRSSVDVKKYINELSAILDEKNVHWTIRVGTRIGRAKPTGQLADFLGCNVLDAFWPTKTQ